MTIDRLLVANRGEIARRVFATCRRLGIGTVAVHSDPDSGLPFVQEADVAVRLPGSSATETYLCGEAVVAAALRAGADAVHPGYGFLSESAEFARAVLAAGLTWVGPSPESIEQMGSKVAAKKLMADAGVPVLDEIAPAAVTESDLPLLVKASAGGGGRGMRVVRRVTDVTPQVERAASEAAAAFGDPTVFCEPYLERARHVEVQVVGDRTGAVLVLGERDCSLQRRHQKVVEETPAPGLSEQTRSDLHAAARRAAEAIGYVGAGTVEFLVDVASERFWFLEMNTRLQVEHTVTECVTGLDLVELQIAVAEGRPLQLPAEPSPVGHAVEVRLYAEDPAADWAPQAGMLTAFDVPDVAAEFGPLTSYGLRVDAGVSAGTEVGTHYDAMLAKIVAWAPTREQALRRLAGALARSRFHGVGTNRDLLVATLRHPDVLSGAVSTDFFERHHPADLVAASADPEAVPWSAFAAAVALAERSRLARREQRAVPPAWRNVVSQPQVTGFVVPGGEVVARWYAGRAGYRSADLPLRVLEASPTRLVLVADRSGESGDGASVRRTFEVAVEGERVDVDSALGHVSLVRRPRFTDPADRVAGGSLLAPMPGSVVAVAVEPGARVGAGEPVLVLEAMKMQHTVAAPYDGVVADLPVTVGQQVAAGAVLAVVHSADDTEGARA